MAYYPYGHVEFLEKDLDKIAKLEGEDFIKRRKILSDSIFPLYKMIVEREKRLLEKGYDCSHLSGQLNERRSKKEE